VAEIEDALALKRAHPDWHVIGERFARNLPGFDGGNSPTDLLRHDLRGRTIAHTTHAGTQGLTGAVNASHVFTGALVNAEATVRAVRALAPQRVTIVRMGQNAVERCAEDDLCAELLAAKFAGQPFDVAGVREKLRHAPAAAKFFDPAATWAPEGDFDLCTAVDSIDLAVTMRRDASGLAALERAD
jgi:2-phosphosulfolactate phosphatase